MKESTCGAYSVQSKLNCLLINTDNVPKLIKSSNSGTQSREVWVKESLLTEGLTPHLLIISGSGKVQDISFDPDTSPPIDYGIEVPNSGNKLPGPYVVYQDLSMVMMKPGTQDFLAWNFDDQTPSIISSMNNLPSSIGNLSTFITT